MGSSYRSDLGLGCVKEWELPLREAVRLIRNVRAEIYTVIGEDGQYDNAADDGGLCEILGLVIRLIERELPAETVESEPRP